MCHAHRAVHKDGRRAVCDKLETVVGRLLTTLAMTVDVRAVANFFQTACDSSTLAYRLTRRAIPYRASVKSRMMSCGPFLTGLLLTSFDRRMH